jgi:diadenosine tetraphosphatase ApaH/serine/threonine PP2A family protein phosphatase
LERCKSIELATYYLAGNGERALLAQASGDYEEDWDVGNWLVARHGAEGLATIGEWPFNLSGSVRGLGNVRLCHGSPRSDNECLTPETPIERLREATAEVDGMVVVHGHTHLQYDRRIEDLRIVGPGSVGLPYTDGPFGARWALLGPDVRLIVTPYDIEDVRAVVAETGYPSERFMDSLERPPSPLEMGADCEEKVFSD